MRKVGAFGFTWVICWFASIWYAALRFELFWTGAFALVLGLLVAGVEASKERLAEKKKKELEAQTIIENLIKEKAKESK